MKAIRDSALYHKQIMEIVRHPLPWNGLKNKKILITGASGMIGTFLSDALMEANHFYNLNLHLTAVSRDEESAKRRFGYCWENSSFSYWQQDVRDNRFSDNWNERFGKDRIDYIIAGASNTHPVQYAKDPIGTIETIVYGTKNIMELAAEQKGSKSLFLSSVEVYGENTGGTELFGENDFGYINCNIPRAGYPESKRLAEAICQAYRQEKGVNVMVARLARTYGPTMSGSDSKAIAQFLRKAIAGEDIILKSKGEQLFSYLYTADAVTGILTVLLQGQDGEAYNIAGDETDIRLKDFAAICADFCGKQVVYQFPDKVEASGYSNAEKALLDNRKLKMLDWTPRYSVRGGIEDTIHIIRAGISLNVPFKRLN